MESHRQSDRGQGSSSNPNPLRRGFYLYRSPNGFNLWFNNQVHEPSSTQEACTNDGQSGSGQHNNNQAQGGRSSVAANDGTASKEDEVGSTNGEVDLGLRLFLKPRNWLPHDNQGLDGKEEIGDCPEIVLSSGYSSYVLEENMAGEGTSSGIRRVTCKKRVMTDGSGPSRRLGLALDESSREVRRPEQQAVAPARNHPGASNLALTVVGDQRWQRNIRLRRTEDRQQIPPPPNFSSWAAGNPQAHAGLCPQCNRYMNGSLAAGMVQHSTPPPMQRFSGVTRVIPGVTASPAFPVNGGPAFSRDETVRNNHRNGTFPTVYWGNGAHQTRNPNLFTNGTTFREDIASSSRSTAPRRANYFQGNVASSFQGASPSNLHHQQTPPVRLPKVNLGDQYAQRLSEIVNVSQQMQELNRYILSSSSSSPTTREVEVSGRAGNVRTSQPLVPFRSTGLTIREVRPAGGGGNPEGASTFLSAAGRGRLVSEVHNALELVRRGVAMGFQDVVVIGPSRLYVVPEEPDEYEDMRLDVDSMSYEELLELEEEIGELSTGLSENAIERHVKRRTYAANEMGSPLKEEPCSICQDEYVNGDNIGKLDCGHDFHFECVKQWLLRKNNCPICKKIALGDN